MLPCFSCCYELYYNFRNFLENTERLLSPTAGNETVIISQRLGYLTLYSTMDLLNTLREDVGMRLGQLNNSSFLI